MGTGNTQNGTGPLLPFGEALVVARSLRLASEKEWRLWCKSGARPSNVPSNPNAVYKHDGWLGNKHWLRHARPNPGTPAPAQATGPVPRPRKRAATNTGSMSAGKPRGKQQRR